MNELTFIKDKALRKTVEDSIEYTYLLFEQSKKEGDTDLFKEETYRVIILYIVSVIEAILLYLFKKRKDEIKYLEYKFVHSIPKEFKHINEKNAHVVVAIQRDAKKTEYQIGLFELVTFFREKKIIKDDIAKEMLKINNIRNTLHFSKPRHEISCDVTDVEKSFEILVNIIQVAQKIPLKISK